MQVKRLDEQFELTYLFCDLVREIVKMGLTRILKVVENVFWVTSVGMFGITCGAVEAVQAGI